MELGEDQVENSEGALLRLLDWFRTTNTSQNPSGKVFTLYGSSGSGKSYVCEQFEFEISKSADDIEFIWLRLIESYNDLVFVMEELNRHFCDIHKCIGDKLTHHRDLIKQNLMSSPKKYIWVAPTDKEIAVTFFKELPRFLSRTGAKDKLRIVLMLSENEIKPLDLKSCHIKSCTDHESAKIIKSVFKKIPPGTVKKLTEITSGNRLLMHMCACIIKEESVIFGASGNHFLSRIIEKDTASSPAKLSEEMYTLKLMNYVWTHLEKVHEFGKFAQLLLVLATFLKPRFPIQIFRSVLFPTSTYHQTSVPPDTPVSEMACDLLQTLGLLHVNSLNIGKISSVTKIFVQKEILPNISGSCLKKSAISMIFLNLRFTEKIVSLIPNPLNAFSTAFLEPNEEYCQHLMAIIRKALRRQEIADSLGVSVSKLLDVIENSFSNSQQDTSEQLKELSILRAEHLFYSGKFEDAVGQLQIAQESCTPGNMLYLRIAQSLCLFFETKKMPEADTYFRQILQFNYPGIVDEESLDSNKSYYETHSRSFNKLVQEPTVVKRVEELIACKQATVGRKINSNSTCHQSSKTGSAVSIVKVHESKLTLNVDVIEEVLDKVGNLPLCVISINGKYREGKSLMLNFFLQYLRQKESNSDRTKWFQPTKLGADFNWRGGSTPETTGIYMYSEPFFIDLDGQLTAIMLMDTQGLFDDQTELALSSTLFAISALLSSVMIINTMHMISEEFLQYFQLYTYFAYLAMGSEETEMNEEEPPSLLTDNLRFLVRDFPGTQEYPLGLHDDFTLEPNYKRYILTSSKNRPSELNFIRDQIDSTFSRVAVNLLPHPGKNLVWYDQLEDLEEDFSQHVKLFVENVFLPENLTQKVIGGQIMTGNSLKPHILKLKPLVESESSSLCWLGQTSAEIQHMIGLANAVMHFENEMTEFFAKNPFGVNELILNEKSHALKCEALTIYKQTNGIVKTQAKKNIPLSYNFDTCIENQIRNFTKLNQKRLNDAEVISKLKAKKRKSYAEFSGRVRLRKFHEAKMDADQQKALVDFNSFMEELQMEQTKEDYDRLIRKQKHLKLKMKEINVAALRNRLHNEELIRIREEEMREEEAAAYEFLERRSIEKSSRTSRRSIFIGVVSAAVSKCVIL